MYINIHIRVYSVTIDVFVLGPNSSRGTNVAEYPRRQTISSHGTDHLAWMGPFSRWGKMSATCTISVLEMMEIRSSWFPSKGLRPNGTTIVHTLMEVTPLRQGWVLIILTSATPAGIKFVLRTCNIGQMRSAYITYIGISTDRLNGTFG